MNAQEFLSSKIEAEADRLFEQNKKEIEDRLKKAFENVFAIFQGRYISILTMCDELKDICVFNRVEQLKMRPQLQRRYYEQAFKNIQGEK